MGWFWIAWHWYSRHHDPVHLICWFHPGNHPIRVCIQVKHWTVLSVGIFHGQSSILYNVQDPGLCFHSSAQDTAEDHDQHEGKHWEESAEQRIRAEWEEEGNSTSDREIQEVKTSGGTTKQWI